MILMTPLQLDRLSSPIGSVLVVWDRKQHLRAIDFEDFEERMRKLLDSQVGHWEISAGEAPNTISRAIEAYFSGDVHPLHALPVKLCGTVFQKRVWEALQAVPPGATISYGTLARRIGQPSASRAAGLANGTNPIAIRIPCHRVVGANGALTGYGGGLWRKKWLIAHEAAGKGTG